MISEKTRALEAEMKEIRRKVKAARKLPKLEQIELLNRLLATFLSKHDKLPDHLKRFVSH